MNHAAETFAVLAIACAAACDRPDAQREGPDVTERDSAGIRIVENHAPVWDAADFWTVDPDPDFVVGGFGAAQDSVSHLVWNIVGAVTLSDGKVAMLAPTNDAKVLVFDAGGTLYASFGRDGRGPGELSYPMHLRVLEGDTIVAWDYMFGPVNRYDASGNLLKAQHIDLGAVVAATRTNNLSPGESMYLPLPDGSFLLEVRRSDGPRPTESGGLHRTPTGYVRVDSAYSAHSFGWWEGEERLLVRDPAVPSALPFATQSMAVGGGSPLSIYVTNGDRYEVHQFSETGALKRVFRRAVNPVAIADPELEDWKDTMIPGNADRDWRRWDRAVAQLPRRYHPAIRNFWVDTIGYLWIQDNWDWEFGTSEWSVFNTEGRWLGTLTVPTTMGIYWIGEDHILGGQVDFGTGLQTVERYRLNRTTGPG